MPAKAGDPDTASQPAHEFNDTKVGSITGYRASCSNRSDNCLFLLIPLSGVVIPDVEGDTGIGEDFRTYPGGS